jgi:arylsulfatase A-like enzyme
MTDPVPRQVLPIPRTPFDGPLPSDARDPGASFPPIERLRPPVGAPNVLVILLDDVGFGASSAFGGPCATPTAERLAGNGLKYNRFHTTALCAPTRAALLSGRNHHTVGMGVITELATSAPGYTSVRPDTCAPLARTLRLNGYSTAQFGKCHEVPVWQTSPMGPFDAWPTGGGGFEYFYGFIGGETNQYHPAIYEGTTPVEPEKGPDEGYHFTADMTDKAIRWTRQQKSLMPDTPFFMYFAPGATHAPHHVPTEWSDRYAGRFDGGWDALREEILARQKSLGVVPPETELTARHDEIPAWEDVPDEMKPVLARQMEVYAGFLEHTDTTSGGSSTPSRTSGCSMTPSSTTSSATTGRAPRGRSTAASTRPSSSTAPRRSRRPSSSPRGSTSSARRRPTTTTPSAGRTRWTRRTSGRSRSPPTGVGRATAPSSTGRTASTPGARSAPSSTTSSTSPPPSSTPPGCRSRRRSTASPRRRSRVSMRYSFDGATEAGRHETQYFEMFCNRGIYHEGWTAVTRHSVPWVMEPLPAFSDDVWELYDTNADWSQAHDLAAEMPEKLAELQRLWLEEARRHNVLPLDDRRIERFDARLAGRPELVTGKSQLLFSGMGRLSEASLINIKNRSHSVTAEVDVPDAGAEGVIIAQGGAFAGWSLYAKDGRPTYCYNLLGLNRFTIRSDAVIPPGTHQVRMEFAYDGGGPAKGGTVTLRLDGVEVGEGRVAATVPLIFSADETADLGRDGASPVSDDYPAGGSVFTGTVNWVQIDVDGDAEDADHLISPEERLRVVMARQ